MLNIKSLEKECYYTLYFDKINKYFVQIINDNNDILLLGLLFSNEEDAKKYKNTELRKILNTNKGPISIKKINRNEMEDYLIKIKENNSVDGIIVDYPNKWSVFKFKKN